MSEYISINVLTYNMSFATQVNKSIGSEKDFVERCQKKYKKGGIQCNTNAIKKLNELDEISLMGIQEVNSAIEPKIKKVQPSLKKHKRVKIGLSTVSILWDPSIFGNKIDDYSFNLTSKKNDYRPCLIILTKKKNNQFLLINIHSPWKTETLEKVISKNLNKCKSDKIIDAFKSKDTNIIVMGDFNDDKAIINKQKPLHISVKRKKIPLTIKKTRKQLKNELLSCCWHEIGHKWDHFDSPGDYILTNSNVKQDDIYIPKEFNLKQRNKLLYSDHKPVMAELTIKYT